MLKSTNLVGFNHSVMDGMKEYSSEVVLIIDSNTCFMVKFLVYVNTGTIWATERNTKQ